ncbi:MAG: hypothetical protein P0S93_05745 [Candidatus Neptunochlamydia sp.]|nr:hypothetical protein [Candidatus Neptunochlamydia sp.]
MESEKKPRFESEALNSFKESFDKEKEVEEKVAKALEFMETLLSDFEKGSFKDFWDVKNLVGPLFKEKMNPIKRNHLWSQYAELGGEARRLKEIKDEQAAFSVEQVELAIEALEADVSHYDRLVKQIIPLDFPEGLKKLSFNKEKYHSIQRELQLLKTLISRLDALRKEILSIDMRISHKNKILKRLSKLGDEVFPKRKELIKKVSESFIADVEAFVKNRFPEGKDRFGAPYYVIRDEIKSFQGFAKLLTLNTQSFTKTRKALSECWDKIKEKEKERRAEMGERSEEHKKNFEDLLPKIEAFEAFCLQKENQERSKILEQSNAIQDKMKKVALGREHVKILKDRIQKARGGALGKVQAKIEERKHAAKKEISDLKEKLENLIKGESSTALEDLEKGESELKEIYERLNLSTMEVHLFEREFADLKSFIFNRKESVVSVEELEELYDQRSAHAEVIKKQMEEYRKEMSGSNLDFEKAMTYRELYDSAKIHLDNEMEALENLEEKLI